MNSIRFPKQLGLYNPGNYYYYQDRKPRKEHIYAVNPPPERYDGDTRIQDSKNGKWNMVYFDKVQGMGDSYSYYKYQEIPDGNYNPRSRCDTAEHYRDISNNGYYRKETDYELRNTIIHPEHYDKITPERLAVDPNQSIHNYYYGNKSNSDQHMERIFTQSRRKALSKRLKRKHQTQMFLASDDGDRCRYDNEYDINDL